MEQSTPSRRNWNKIDPVEYFRESYEGKITTRTQLQKQDKGLYHILNKQGKLDQILPNTQENNRDWNTINPVKYFKENYQGKITTRQQLHKQDQSLYRILLKQGKLDVILPNKRENERDWNTNDPEQYFKQHYEGTITTRTQLHKQDQSLYRILLKQGKLDVILPNKRENERDWNTNDPEQYFKQHYEGTITTRTQLEQEDPGLYKILRKQGKLDQVLPNQNKDFRDWNKIDPEQYFKEHYQGKITSRKQLQKQDQSLYTILLKQGKLDITLPNKRKTRDWNKIDPEQYFKEHYQDKTTTKHQLHKKDPGLYHVLKKQGKLDLVFPPPNQREILEQLLENYNQQKNIEDKLEEGDQQ